MNCFQLDMEFVCSHADVKLYEVAQHFAGLSMVER